MNRGKLVILLMLLAGCLMGGIAVAFHHWLSRRAIAWWGPENVETIRNAPRLEALKLAAASGADSGDIVTIGNSHWIVVERKDVSRASGIDHIRHGLLEDAHFVWGDLPPAQQTPKWQFGLTLTAVSKQLTVVFDREGHVGRSDTDEILPISSIAKGWGEFFAEQFGASTKESPPK